MSMDTDKQKKRGFNNTEQEKKLFHDVKVAVRQSLDRGGLLTFSDFYKDISPVRDSVVKSKRFNSSMNDIDTLFSLIDVLSDTVTIDGDLLNKFRYRLKSDSAEDLAKSYLGFIKSLPLKYEIFIPLKISFPEGIDAIGISDSMSFVKSDSSAFPFSHFKDYRSATTILGLVDTDAAGAAFLKITELGYINHLDGGVVFEKTLSILKKIIYLSVVYGCFSFKKTTLEKVKNWSAYAVSTAELKVKRIEISRRINEVLNSFTASDSLFLSKDSLASTFSPEEAFREKFIYIMAFLDNIDDKNLNHICTSLEWAFESEISDNEDFKFVQICIALEAVLGELGKDELPLSQTLADRCAYLLGKNPNDRKFIKAQFLKIYKQRSNLVHGKNHKLDDGDKELLSTARTFLHSLLKKEIELILQPQLKKYSYL